MVPNKKLHNEHTHPKHNGLKILMRAHHLLSVYEICTHKKVHSQFKKKNSNDELLIEVTRALHEKQKNSMVLEQTSHQCKHTGPAQQVKTHPQKEGMDRIALHALFEERKKA